MTGTELREWVSKYVPEEDMPANEIIVFFACHAKNVWVGVHEGCHWVMISIDYNTTINWNDRDGFEFPDEVLYSLWRLMGEQSESTSVQ
jgi:hypothetical protein